MRNHLGKLRVGAEARPVIADIRWVEAGEGDKAPMPRDVGACFPKVTGKRRNSHGAPDVQAPKASCPPGMAQHPGEHIVGNRNFLY